MKCIFLFFFLKKPHMRKAKSSIASKVNSCAGCMIRLFLKNLKCSKDRLAAPELELLRGWSMLERWGVPSACNPSELYADTISLMILSSHHHHPSQYILRHSACFSEKVVTFSQNVTQLNGFHEECINFATYT